MKETFICPSNMPGTNDFAAIMFELESDKANSTAELKKLARKAAKLYAMTDEGCTVYSDNNDNFNWQDLINQTGNDVFMRICNDLHLKITYLGSTSSDDAWLDSNEQLMENISVEITNIEWETDNEDVDLPTKVTLDINDPTTDIADALSDEYGFLVKNYCIEDSF